MPAAAHLLWLIPVLPLLGAVFNGFLALAASRTSDGPNRGIVGFLAVAAPALSFVLVLICTFALEHAPKDAHGSAMLSQSLWTWFQVGDVPIRLGFAFDRLTAVMLLFVTGIGTLIHLYSIGYMAHDRGFARFMAYLNLFMFAMITLVLGDGLVVTFLGWEGVGLCSYLLIGFWHQNDDYNDAARKAFVMNRIGDLGFLLGAFILVWACGHLDYVGINQAALGGQLGGSTLAAACLLLFLGCTGKSAQIPLLTWLPDAMAGPTPVSALIHAATMVTSGVYLVARLGPAFGACPDVLSVILVVGCLTAVFGAVAGLFQHDIKKALAYSTVSQLGFMFMAIGCGAYTVAIFHVFTHAFFKATLFLGSGAVIHGLGHEQDMRRMGGLAKLMPFTWIVMLIGWWAIIGLPPFAGFWSKDLILERLFAGNPLTMAVGVIAVFTALITAIYMTRMLVLTFKGQPRVERHAGDLHALPITMGISLAILAIGSAVAGCLWMGIFGEQAAWFQHYLSGVLGGGEHLARVRLHIDHDENHTLAYVVAIMGTLTAITGGLWAWLRWTRPQSAAVPAHGSDTAPTGFGGAWTYAFDRVYDLGVVLPVRLISMIAYGLTLLPLVGPAAGGTARFLADGYVSLQRSRLRSQLTLSLAGVVAILAVLFFHLK